MERQGAWYLGVDGGGSKTLAVVVDETGTERGRGEAGSSNYRAVGLDTAATNLRAAAESAALAAGAPLPLDAAWFGLAGLDTPGDSAILEPSIRHLARTARLSNDAELVLCGLGARRGVALVAGTGAIALGRDGAGRVVRSSGWGHVLGDEGSGYDLGRQALRAALRAADGRGRRTALLPAVLATWQLNSHDALLEVVYRGGAKATIAGLAPLVVRCAREGDAVAGAILRHGAQELALAVRAVARGVGAGDSPLALAVGGGLLVHEASYRVLLLRLLERRQPLSEVVVVEQPALSAARAAADLTPTPFP